MMEASADLIFADSGTGTGCTPGLLVARLMHHARHQPDTPALITDAGPLGYRALLETSWQAACREGRDSARQPDCTSGTNSELAHRAFVASWQGRPFWPGAAASGVPLPSGPIPPATELIVSTSGSTGHPKAVCLSGTALLAAARAVSRVLSLGPGDIWLSPLPMVHIGGLSTLWRAIDAGAGVCIIDKFSVRQLGDALARDGITHLSLVPAMLAQLLDANVPPATLRYVLVGGGPLDGALYRRARALGWPLCPSYGMSESAALVACHLPENDDWHEGQVGTLLPGMEARIDACGRLCLRGEQMMQAYLGPAHDAPFDADGWFTTSDLAHREDNGSLFILGRADDVIVTGGKNIHPAWVESGLAGCPGVADVAVVGEPHAVWGQQVVALVNGPASEKDVLAWGQQHLASALRPRRVVHVGAIPRTALGKIARAHLKDLLPDAR